MFWNRIRNHDIENDIIPNLDLGLIEYSDQPIERLISSSINLSKSQFLENVEIILDKFSDLFATRNYIFSGGSIKI